MMPVSVDSKILFFFEETQLVAMSKLADTQGDVHAELQQYMKDKDLNTLFVSIVEAILLDKPDEPVSFIMKYLKKSFPDKTTDSIPVSTTLQHVASVHSDDSDSDSDESVHDEVKLEPRSLPLTRNKRRTSICAEKLCPTKFDTEIKKIPKSLDEEKIIKMILKKNVLFEHLDEIQMQNVQDAMFPVEKDVDDIIIRQGDDGDNFYVIESGQVDVSILSAESGNNPNLVVSLSDGDSFGELAIMYNAPRAATCTAKSKVKLWALDRVSFKIILMKTAISKRLQYKEFLQKVPILSQLTENEHLVIVDALHEDEFEENTVICSEGDQGDKFYIIKEGSVICTKKTSDGKSKEVAHLKSGAYFGEIALMTTKRRQATVTTSGKLSCLSLDRKTFKRVMGPLQDILMRNMEEYKKFQSLSI